MTSAPLRLLHTDIDERVRLIREGHGDWLCGKGCDRCCKRLADVPQLTGAEWALLQEGLAALPPDQLDLIATRITALGPTPARPVTCPLLDPDSGACPVYAQRPVACRTYGFYVDRELGLYCRDIEQQAADGALDQVIWGNHEVIEHALARLGPQRSLTAWFEDWQAQRR